MMKDFDKDLFIKLSEKYNVEMSKMAKTPMIKDEYGTHVIGEKDIRRIFSNKITDEREVSR